MLLARENSIFRPTCRVCLHLQLLDGHPSLHFPPRVICVASLLQPLILQTLLSSSVLTALSAFLLFPLGFVCPPSSSSSTSALSFKPQLQASSSPGPTSRPPCWPCSCCWHCAHTSQEEMEAQRKGGWRVNINTCAVLGAMFYGHWTVMMVFLFER